jgi:16S rRNA C967 or C1407 C5-methylase (RsmB/RsmF family)/NOL1/NOP2/fmu family ribosome biogenesis protein
MASTFPAAFEKRMRLTLGNDWELFAEAHQESVPVSIRVNPSKIVKNIPGLPMPWTTYGRYLPQRPVFTLDPLFHAGAYYVQEASSMFLEQAFWQCVPTEEPLRVLDLCAAPGGKSTHILSLISKDCLLVSNEVIRSRVNILSENIQKWGNTNVVVTNNDPADFSRLEGFFDVIVIDAPCSGEGLFRKDQNAMEEWSVENVNICTQRQQRIVSEVWPALKENGILVYSTCTYNQHENEDNLKWLSHQHDVEFLPLKTEESWGVEEVRTEKVVGYRCYPHRVKGEGFFLAVIRKKEAEGQVSIRRSKNNFTQPTKTIREQLSNWFKDDLYLIQRNELIQGLPTAHVDAISLIQASLRITYAGVFIATVKHDKLIPEHALAVSSSINYEAFYRVELDEANALQFLRKETLSIQPNYKGFALATYNHLGLGFMNVLPGRVNNLYPSEWRIRMK